jgi:hypothetical protein
MQLRRVLRIRSSNSPPPTPGKSPRPPGDAQIKIWLKSFKTFKSFNDGSAANDLNGLNGFNDLNSFLNYSIRSCLIPLLFSEWAKYFVMDIKS